MKKRIVSLLMALALCLSLLPTAALAAEGEPAEQLVEQEQLKPVEPAPAEPEEGAPVEDAEEEEKEELPEEPKEQQDERPVQPEPVMLAMANGVALQAVDVAGHTNHDEGWTAISTADALTAINAAGNYYLTNNIEISTTWQPVTGVVLCLNGKSITEKGQLTAIVVPENSTFTLCDCTTGTGQGKITHENAVGRGVYMMEGSTFTMYGGNITGNVVHAGDGGGVYVKGGSTFNMSGGSITGNTARKVTGRPDGGNGGGVYVNGTFNMYGGEIRNNTAPGTGDGGGVFVNYNGTFNMSDDSSITGNTAFRGGGVCVERNSVGSNNYKPGNFAMSSGAVGGATTDDANQAEYGGGVYVAGAFTLTGGSITGNKTNGNGGGVYVNADSTFTVSGAPKITDNTQKPTTSSNVYLTTGKPGAVIVIGDAHLASGAKIGVKTGETPTVGNPVTIATNANSGDKQYFSSDESEYSMYVEGSELKLAIVPAHEHRWTYTASNATTITAKCGDNSCTSGNGGSITINKPSTNLTYSGSEKAARLTESNWQGSNVTIVYKQGDKVLTGAPVNAGTYTASITLGGATASVEYTIAKATPTADDFTFTAPSNLTYDGNAKTALVNSSKSGMGAVTLKYYKGNSPLSAAPTDAGEYTVKINVAEGDNYESATNLTADGWKFSIAKADYTGVTKTMEVPVPKTQLVSHNYNVNKLTLPELPEGAQYSKGVDLSDAFKNGTKYPYAVFPSGCIEGWNAGTERNLTFKTCGCEDGYSATMTFHVIGTANYNDYDVIVTVTFVNQTQETLPVTMTGWTYGGTAKEPGYTAPAGTTKTTITYEKKNADGSFTVLTDKPSGAGNYRVKVVCESNVAVYTGTVEFRIAKATPTGEPKYTKIAAGGKTLADAGLTVTGSTLSPNAGELVWVDDAGNALANTTVVEKNTTYKWRFTPNDANYEALTGSVELYHVSGGYYYYTPAAGGTTDANKSPRTGDAGLLVYGLTALSSYTGTALVLRRKRED